VKIEIGTIYMTSSVLSYRFQSPSVGLSGIKNHTKMADMPVKGMVSQKIHRLTHVSVVLQQFLLIWNLPGTVLRE
jgi:hypothetical protein